jgi:hypothetical protein
MQVEILIDDTVGRFKKGEVGILLENDYPEKYDFFVRLEDPRRDFYFFKDEVKHLKTNQV